MKKHIYTIGYAHVFEGKAFPQELFVGVLRDNNIRCLIDVRSYPQASYFYRNYAIPFGARQENREYWSEMDEYDKKSGNYKKRKINCLDFEKFTQGKEFKEGVENLKKEPYNNLCLMCAEKDPIMCHRTIMIARALDRLNDDFVIQHIVWSEEENRFAKKPKSQKEIDEILLKHYKTDKIEQDLFGPPPSEEERIQEAYRRANSAIGYSGNKNDDNGERE